MSGVEVDLDRGTRTAELQELVWSAAAGLSPRDQALLDLNLRQGLEGQDLADAMGTSLNNSYVMLSRLRDQVERSLGALLIARLGREDCEELDAILQGWDGRFSPLLRKRVARHVDGCDVCRERRAAVASPMALLAAAPLVPAPAPLRERVLHDLGSDAPVAAGALHPRRVRRARAAVASADARPGGSRPPPSCSSPSSAACSPSGGGDDSSARSRRSSRPRTTTEAATSTTDAPTTTTVPATTTTTGALEHPDHAARGRHDHHRSGRDPAPAPATAGHDAALDHHA